MAPRIVILEDIHADGIELMREWADVSIQLGLPRDQLLALTPERIALYRQDRPIPATQEKVYCPVRDYWRGKTIGVISHPNWVERDKKAE